ncbi:MAG: 2-C-methyl-D-erythritol 4-phosphate cytidylyltransferase [Spirochaetes bacterium]|nr:2-C-methyl-D-erythritol 4-phosphate cytidylyltransferase [Spirochaetota bacterium]
MFGNINCYAIILAGGSGKRAGTILPKQFNELNGKAVLAYSLEVFEKNSFVDGIVIVTHPDYFSITKSISDKSLIKKLIGITEGGAQRKDSSYNGLKYLNCPPDSIVMIHDAARPFIDDCIIENSIRNACLNGATAVYTQATDTIAIFENKKLKSIPPRENCFMAQTPQTFKYELIMKAHEASKTDKEYTDDVSLVIDMEVDIALTEGNAGNFKITTPEDFERALIYLRKNR